MLGVNGSAVMRVIQRTLLRLSTINYSEPANFVSLRRIGHDDVERRVHELTDGPDIIRYAKLHRWHDTLGFCFPPLRPLARARTKVRFPPKADLSRLQQPN